MNELEKTTDLLMSARGVLNNFTFCFGSLVEPEIYKIEKVILAIYEYVEERKKLYTVDYFGGDIDRINKGKAEINNAIEQIASVRKSFQQEYNNPISSILDVFKKTEKSLLLLSDELKTVSKQAENIEKQKKKEVIEKYFQDKKYDVIRFEQIFNERWLNKTYKISDVYSDIDSIILKIIEDLKTIESLGIEPIEIETIKSFYLQDLDIGKAIKRQKELKIAKENIKKEQEKRDIVEEQHIQEAFIKQEESKKSQEKVTSYADDVLGISSSEYNKIYKFTLTFECDATQRSLLKKFMLENGIRYTQINLGANNE